MDQGLLGHWKLAEDCRDSSGNGNHGTNHGVVFAGRAGTFDGRTSWVEVEDSPTLRLGSGDFTVSVLISTDRDPTDVPGDILSKFDPARRAGFNLGLLTLAGVTSSQPNFGNLHFGIDSGAEDPVWHDCGRPGAALYVCAMAVHEGSLYAGTFESGEAQAGHVYRLDGTGVWADCGTPDRCNAVTSLAVHDGALHAGVSHYRSVGSSLVESPNLRPGGKVLRYAGGREWVDCGKPEGPSASQVVSPDYMNRFAGWEAGKVDAIHGLAVYGGELYAIPMYHQGLYRYEGGTRWVDCGSPGVRLMSLTVYNGHLYAAGNEGGKRGGVFRLQGRAGAPGLPAATAGGGGPWVRTGDQTGVDQTYAFAVYEGRLHSATWPEATVFRYEGNDLWIGCGRLGSELEVMAMAVYNGKLYAGTLPTAEVYRLDGDGTWTVTGQLDMTPGVKYRRVWSMAVHKGRLYAGTLPSGRVLYTEAGQNVTVDRALTPGRHRVTAVRRQGCLNLFVDGRLEATSGTPTPPGYDISSNAPLRIGSGASDCFLGQIADLRLYGRALNDDEVTRWFSN